MSKFKRKFDFAKDKFSGEVKEAAGKVTGNEQLELKGKIQSAGADLKNKVGDIKEDIVKKIEGKK